MNDIIHETAQKIESMEIRGAGRIAVAASNAIKIYVENLNVSSMEEFKNEINQVRSVLINTRPTAVSLPNAVKISSTFKSNTVDEAKKEIIENADNFIKSAQKAIDSIGEIGSRRISNGSVILTHCN